MVPLLYGVALCPDERSAANLGAISGLVFYGVSLHWLVKVFGWAAASFWCVFALWLACFCLLARRLDGWRGRKDSLLRDIGFAVAAGTLWTGLEYFRSEVWWLACPWLALGFSQASNLAVLQSMSLWGVYGVSAGIVAVNAALSLAARGRWKAAALALVCVSAVGAWGHRRFRSPAPAEGRPASVALVQDESFDWRRLARLSLGPRAEQADLLVWPEYGFLAPPSLQPRMQEAVSAALRGRKGITVAAGAVLPDGPTAPMENFAWAFSADGRLLGRVDKRHPIPFVEKRLPARRSSAPVDTPLGRLGVQICYDLDFEDVSRELARQGAEILVVPNLDPVVWGEWQHAQHSRMAAARAAETGLPVVRAASSGFSQIIDPRGETAAWTRSTAPGVLFGSVRLAGAATFYTRFGWLAGPVSLAFTVIAGLVLLLGKRRSAAAKLEMGKTV